ncbi:MAG: transcriptional regulator [Bryobacterales bacterium]|nr:transcriptional regulator [Bryobacterales bacterium]MBV9396510.1 transcriptional regulator [Bryobacterales bacterium]
MRFMMIAKFEKEGSLTPTPALMAAMGKFTQDLAQTGALIETGGLQPTARGAQLKLSGGKVTVTDGPFTEAKEVIGGYAIVEFKSKQEAIELGKRFLQLHADILGPSCEMLSEIREMYEPGQIPGC